jgi:hypothetical protein
MASNTKKLKIIRKNKKRPNKQNLKQDMKRMQENAEKTQRSGCLVAGKSRSRPDDEVSSSGAASNPPRNGLSIIPDFPLSEGQGAFPCAVIHGYPTDLG